MTTKEKEINAIEALIEMDGYFAEYFKGDLKIMLENIRKDFPIEMGTKFSAQMEYYQPITGKLIKFHADEIIGMCDELLCLADRFKDNHPYDIAVRKLGRKNVIARKYALGLPINKDEINYLLILNENQ